MQDWQKYGLIALGAFVVYQMYQNGSFASLFLSTTVATTTSYSPVSNAAGNEWSCPQGTSFYPIKGVASGSGYCV